MIVVHRHPFPTPLPARPRAAMAIDGRIRATLLARSRASVPPLRVNLLSQHSPDLLHMLDEPTNAAALCRPSLNPNDTHARGLRLLWVRSENPQSSSNLQQYHHVAPPSRPAANAAPPSVTYRLIVDLLCLPTVALRLSVTFESVTFESVTFESVIARWPCSGSASWKQSRSVNVCA